MFYDSRLSVPSSFLCVHCVKPLTCRAKCRGITQRTQRKEKGTENFIFDVANLLSRDLRQSVGTSVRARPKTQRLKPMLLRSKGGVPTAIDEERVAADEIGSGACQENCGANQIGRLRKSAKLDAAEQLLRASFVFAERAAGVFR